MAKFNLNHARFTVFYLVALGLLFIATLLILIALFTSNWIKTAAYLVENNVYYTFGLWFVCTHKSQDYLKANFLYSSSLQQNYVGWQNVRSEDNACQPIEFNYVPWIYICHIFYTLCAAINLVSLGISIFGLFISSGRSNILTPSILFVALLVSVASQVITISIYGGIGVRNYTRYEPDYSFILACIALGFDFGSAVLYYLEMSYQKRIYG